MNVYSFDISATAINVDVELADNERARFVKPAESKLQVQTAAN